MAGNHPLDINRRDALKSAASVALAGGTAVAARTSNADDQQASLHQRASVAKTPLRILRENEREGARDWQLTRVRLDKPGGVRCPPIEGYCSKQSVLAGESVDIMVSRTKK